MMCIKIKLEDQYMDLITIFNYPKDNQNYTDMCRIWLQCANEFKGSLNVRIFTQDGVNESVEELIKKYGFSLEKLSGIKVNNGNSAMANKMNHNIGFKLYNLCKQTEPFVFVDADAFILESMDTLVRLSAGKPFVGVNHEKVPNHTAHIPQRFLNSGVQVVNDPSILDFSKITQMKIVMPGTDQSLLFSYFKFIGYDYTTPGVGFGWNAYAHYVDIINQDGKWIAKSKLENGHDVHINHYWNPESKPWNIDCPIYKKYLKDGDIFV